MAIERRYFAQCLESRAYIDIDDVSMKIVGAGTDGPSPYRVTLTLKQNGVATRNFRAKRRVPAQAEKPWDKITENTRSLKFEVAEEQRDGRTKISPKGQVGASWDLV